MENEKQKKDFSLIPHAEITVDDLLNSSVTSTADTERFRRIMEYRNAQATNGLTASIDRVNTSLEAANVSSSAQQKKVANLTLVIAACTFVYTVITGFSVWVSYQQAKAAKDALVGAYYKPDVVDSSLHLVFTKGVDERGDAAYCVDGMAYTVPSLNAGAIKPKTIELPPEGEAGLIPVIKLRCKP